MVSKIMMDGIGLIGTLMPREILTTMICSTGWTDSTSKIMQEMHPRWRDSRWDRWGESTIAIYFGNNISQIHVITILTLSGPVQLYGLYFYWVYGYLMQFIAI